MVKLVSQSLSKHPVEVRTPVLRQFQNVEYTGHLCGLQPHPPPPAAPHPLHFSSAVPPTHCISAEPRPSPIAFQQHHAPHPLHFSSATPPTHCISAVPRSSPIAFQQSRAPHPLHFSRAMPPTHCISAAPCPPLAAFQQSHAPQSCYLHSVV